MTNAMLGLKELLANHTAKGAPELVRPEKDGAVRCFACGHRCLIREGKAVEEIMDLIEEDSEIGVLVLGAGADADGPGPLVNQMVTKLGHKMPVPVTVVPGLMTEDRIDQVC